MESATSSGSLTVATTVVSAKPSRLHSLVLNPGSAASSVTVYDNATTNSGTVLASLVAAANGSSVTINLLSPVEALAGITVVVAGTAATAVASYTRTY